jgi:hypothetical protein
MEVRCDVNQSERSCGGRPQELEGAETVLLKKSDLKIDYKELVSW